MPGLLGAILFKIGLAVSLAAVLDYFHRLYPRRYLLRWAQAWWAAAFHSVLGLLQPMGVVGAPSGQTALVIAAATSLFGYAHIGLIFVGAWELSRRERASSRVVGSVILVASALLLGRLAVEALVSGGGNPVWFGRVLVVAIGLGHATGVLAIAKGLRVVTAGAVITLLGFLLHGAVHITDFSLGTGLFTAAPPTPSLLLAVSFVEFVFGLGGLIWLFEDEEDRARAAAEGSRLADERSLARFQKILDQGWDVVELRNRRGALVWVSETIERVLGVDPDVYGKEPPLSRVHPADRDGLLTALSGEDPTNQTLEIRLEDGSGRIRRFETVCVDLTDDPDVGAVVVTSRDITSRSELQREIVEISARERRRVGKDLHDGLGQVLTGIGFRVAQLDRSLSGAEPGIRDVLTEVRGLVKNAVKQVGVLARGLSPVTVSPQGLVSALQALADEMGEGFGIRCAVDADQDAELTDPGLATELYLIVQDAAYYAAKERKASNIRIGFMLEDTEGIVSIWDDGAEPDDPDGAGLAPRLPAHRARVIGGVLNEEERPGGRMMECRFPLP